MSTQRSILFGVAILGIGGLALYYELMRPAQPSVVLLQPTTATNSHQPTPSKSMAATNEHSAVGANKQPSLKVPSITPVTGLSNRDRASGIARPLAVLQRTHSRLTSPSARAIPTRILCEGLSHSDVPNLNAWFAQTPSLLNRKGLVKALGQFGDKTSVHLLTNTLTSEFATRVLPLDELRTMLAVPTALGYLASEHEEAYAFLLAASEPSFWTTRVPWVKLQSRSGLDNTMARVSLQALGFSGRPEVPVIVEQLIARDSVYLREFNSAIVQTAFTYEAITTLGREKYLEMGGMEAFRTWSKTPSGSAWREWAKQYD